jgi:hypothetical protein
MNIENIARFTVLNNLIKLGLLNEDGTAVSYSVFKNKASIMKYGKQTKHQLKVVYVGFPKENLFGFYVECDTDPNCMKQAYSWYCKLVKNDIDSDNIDIHWGNCGFPIQYGYIRALG